MFSHLKNLLVSVLDEQILVISINWPEVRNCVNSETAKELLYAFDYLESEPSLKIGILKSEGKTSFCSGFDLKEVV